MIKSYWLGWVGVGVSDSLSQELGMIDPHLSTGH